MMHSHSKFPFLEVGGLLLLLLLASCTGSHPKYANKRFVTEARCPITPMKNQGKSPSCWIYAMLATIESNRLAMGDSVNLSAAYYERMLIAEEAEAVFKNKGEGEIKGRGMIPYLMTMLHRYGAFMENSYHHRKEEFNFGVLSREALLVAKNAAGGGKSLASFQSEIGSLLDREISYLPKRQFLLGADYSPMEFGHSVALIDDYEFLGVDYAFPDRRKTDVIKSTEPDSLLLITEKSIREGRAVCWEGDTSESGYDWKNGVADIDEDRNTIMENYHKEIERSNTTDDHCLEICGIAHDENGKKFFICKNSWGKSNRFKGFLMMSFDYFLAKTLVIGKIK